MTDNSQNFKLQQTFISTDKAPHTLTDISQNVER